MLEQIRRRFAKELIDETSVDLDFVEGHAHEDQATLRRYGTHDRYVHSAIDEMKSWAFERPARRYGSIGGVYRQLRPAALA